MSEKELGSRRARLAALREKGIDPYPARVGPRQRIVDVRRRFDDRDTEALESDPQVVAVVGRVIAVRSFGKLIFLQIFEDGAEIQACAKKKEIDGELFDRIRDFEVGDFVWVEGPIWRTRTGELTVDVRAAQIAAKSLRPLPEKWHGLSDVEARTRQRYLDLLSNEETRRVVILRSRTISAMRAFLDSRGFLEVETPVLQPIYGGAAAEPFVTHHNRYEQRLYLRISDELYLKRLVVGGLDRVYEIGHNFRNEGVSRKHNPEFTMMECYQAYADYRDMMDLAEEMIGELALYPTLLAQELLGTLPFLPEPGSRRFGLQLLESRAKAGLVKVAPGTRQSGRRWRAAARRAHRHRFEPHWSSHSRTSPRPPPTDSDRVARGGLPRRATPRRPSAATPDQHTQTNTSP